LYRDHRETFYCGCGFDERKVVLPENCGYSPRENDERAHRIEWEHVVPTAAFGRHRACWSNPSCRDAAGDSLSPRECCRATDEEFRSMEAELQNLVPEIGELNEDRSARPYGQIAGESRDYGRCDFEVDFDANVVEPREEIRGDIARTYLYMLGVYGSVALPLDEEEVEQFWVWHEADPPDAWERERNLRIGELQGELNPLVSNP
jgi:deoxyribonuclease-1